MKSALILIDIQNDYFPGGKMELGHAEQAGSQAKILLDAARRKGILVIHVQHLATRLDAPSFVPDTPGVAIHDLVKPEMGETIIRKNFPNSFRATGLQEILTATGVDHLFIAGMMTHMCVDATVRAAADLNYPCTLASDACATRDLIWDETTISADNVQGSFLSALSGLYATVLPTSEIIQMIRNE